MAYEGFFRFGGNEIINNERARGYSQTAACPMYWLKGPQCATLQDALGDSEYTFANIPDAPWYDPSMPDVTSRFYGVFALSVSGLNDSTRSASVVEGIDDGAQIGRTRKGSRQARVRAILLAKGRDALDYGVAWLNAALDPDACGQHGTGCGTTDLEFFTDCPPERGTVPDFTPWAVARRNEAVNPSFETGVAGWSGTGASLAASADWASSGDQSMKITATSANPNSGDARVVPSGSFPPGVEPGKTYTVSADVFTPSAHTGFSTSSSSRQRRVLVFISTPGGGANVPNFGPQGPNVAGEFHVEHTFTVPADATGVIVAIGAAGSATDADFVSYVDSVLIQEGTDGADYFDGSTEGNEFARYSWAGAANASASIEEVRSPIDRPRTDEEYAAIVDPYRRFLHNVAVTSGPYERELMNVGDFWGQVFEWTYTAGRPWVYSATRQVDLPVTPTIVIQDTPYNLVPYPSAELAGADVDAATNYSANPSVETNATGWASGADGVNITSAMLASGRVTGELQAVGNSSYRVVFTASGAGANGSFYAQQEVSLAGRPAGSRVSINFWAAELLMAGTPVRADIVMRAYWRATSGGAVLRTDTLGTIPVNGGALSVKSLVPPAGANFVLVRAEAFLSSWPAGTIVRLYADALAVTVP